MVPPTSTPPPTNDLRNGAGTNTIPHQGYRTSPSSRHLEGNLRRVISVFTMPGEATSQRWIVLDTGALIAGTDTLYALGGLTEGVTGTAVPSLAEDERAVFYVTSDVAAETRDARARARLQALDRVGCVVQRAPSSEAVAAVLQAAKNSGDYAVLSTADLRVLALTWMLEVERNGRKFLTEVPKATVVGELRRVPGVSFEELERWETEERERKEKEEQEGDGWTTVESRKIEPMKKTKKKKKKKKTRTGKAQIEGETGGLAVGGEPQGKEHGPETPVRTDSRERSVPEVGNTKEELAEMAATEDPVSTSEHAETMPPNVSLNNEMHTKLNFFETKIETKPVGETQEQQETPEESAATNATSLEEVAVLGDEISDDDGVGWINEGNLEEHLARDGGEEEMTAEDRMRVACVTTDFAMQNTMLQMGLKLLSVDGRRTIRQIRRFALRCQSCSNVTRELQRKFCEKCGNATLHRVAFKVDKKGVARVFLNPKKKPILRGTKYPIPLPRGGRHNKDLILSEDQIDPVKQRRLDKQRERLNVDVLDPSSFYNAGAKFNPHDRPLIVGYGKRNPNQVRPTSKGKR